MRIGLIAAAAAAASGISGAAAASPPSHLAAGSLEWRQMFPGVSFAPAYGDWEKGAHGKYVRIDAGAEVPMHIHSNAYHAVLISGEVVNLYEDSDDITVDPGSYFYVAGKRPHGHRCKSSEPCFFYTYGDGLWDVTVTQGQ